MTHIKIFNPLDKENLGKSVSTAILTQPVIPFTELRDFVGAGVYAIYYTGDFPLYKKIAFANKDEFMQPIYAGKAVPQGSRKGNLILDSLSGNDLYRRLNDHRKSIESVQNLSVEDFYFRYLIVDDIWIPLTESMLIEKFSPVWNVVLEGFGNHNPGDGRYNGKIPLWDMVHPGREWAKKLKPRKETIGELLDKIIKHLHKTLA